MRGWVKSLAKLCRLPVFDGFTELDIQIDKVRMLRDSYKLQAQISHYGAIPENNIVIVDPA